MQDSQTQAFAGKVLVLSGGVGGAKLVHGLANTLGADQLTVVANTADDFDHWGLRICPDIDSITYALAGINDEKRGWGLKDESWRTMVAMRRLSGEDWFQLGDQDIATHLYRSMRLRNGDSLTDITADIAQRLGVTTRLLPMSDDVVATRVYSDRGEYEFQHYFVRERCEPKVERIEFIGIDTARLSPLVKDSIADPELSAIILSPSNPFLSIDPILSLEDCRKLLKNRGVPIIAVSPIISGRAVKGPAAKLMEELNMPTSAHGVAEYYGDLLDGFVFDELDAAELDVIRNTGINCRLEQTLMTDMASKEHLARVVLEFARDLKR